MDMKTSPVLPIWFAAIAISSHCAYSAQVPHIFSSNTPAVAGDVNENFQYLVDNSLGAHLIDGEIFQDVDCTSNPAALNETYGQFVNYRNLNFAIKGNCYGDITIKREVDNDGNWTGNSYQVAGQNISIYLQGENAGGLIPNDLSGSVTIWGGFGGGLYLSGLKITMGEQMLGVAFSRNGQGALNDVEIIGPETPSGTGVFAQEGSQVYLNGVSISKTGWGVHGRNGANIRILGNPTTISSQWDGVVLVGSSLFQQAELNISSTEENATSINLSNGSDWFQSGSRTINNTGRIDISSGSNMNVGTINSSTKELSMNNGSLNVDYLNVSHANLNKAKVYALEFNSPSGDLNIQNSIIESGSLTANSLFTDSTSMIVNGGTIGNVDATRNSYITLRDVTVNTAWADRHAAIQAERATIAAIGSSYNAHITMQDSSVTDALNFNHNSSIELNNVTFTGDGINFHSSVIEIKGTNKVPTNKLACASLSRVYYEGIDDILSTVPDSNCLDYASEGTLMQILKHTHVAP